jgi:hypothetical protein
MKWYHDLSVDSMTEHTVYASGKGSDINIDCHRAGECEGGWALLAQRRGFRWLLQQGGTVVWKGPSAGTQACCQ